MIKNIARILNAEKGEERPVMLMFGLGFFMGIYLYSFKIVCEAIFLSRMEEYLAKAMFVSALLGVISASVFSYLQNRISFSKLTFLNQAIIFLFIGSVRLLYDTLTGESLNILVFVSFIMIQPMISVALLNFWGIFGRIFNLRQSKRIISGIDSGQLLAAFITSLSIPLIAKLIVEIDFLMISLVAILLDLIFLAAIVSKYDLEKHRTAGTKGRVNTKFSGMLKEKYVVYLSLFLLFSIISFQFVHYSFLSVTKIYYPSESQLVSFLGFFNAAMMVVSLIIQTFVNEKLIAMYGLKTTLLILPILLGTFTIVSVLIGGFFGYTVASPTFIWFFLFIALSKLISESLRESIETPSYKLFFMPLDIKIRFDIQAKVEGVINEFSRLIAGIGILAVGFLGIFNLIHYSLILLLVVIVWIWSTNKLYGEYRVNVKKKLQGNTSDNEINQKKQRRFKSLIDSLEKRNTAGNMIFALKILEKWDSDLFKAYVNKFVASPNEQIRKFNLDKMNELRGIDPFNKNIIELGTINGGDRLAQWFNSLESDKKNDPVELKALLKSKDPEDRICLARMLGKKANEHNSYMLMELLDDPDGGVKKAAIKSIGIAGLKEAYPLLVAELKSPKFTDQALNALIEIGEEAFPALENAFYKLGQNIKIMLKILQVYGKVGGRKAIELLWDKIDYPDKKIIAQVLISLGDCDFLANESQVQRIKFAIEGDLANIAWNLKAWESIPNGIDARLLQDALEYDIQTSVDHIFMLLTMLYDSYSIQLVQENLFEKSGEGLTYAIELLDVFLSDDIKEKIIFMLDDVLGSKNLNKMANYYPLADIKFTEMLRMAINRDFNLNNRWTKACAIHFIGEKRVSGYELDLIAHLFNPDPLIREISAWSLFHLKASLFNEQMQRLDFATRKELESMIVDKVSVRYKKMLRFHKILFLKDIGIFEFIPCFVLSNAVEMSQELLLAKGNMLQIDSHNPEYIYVLKNGLAELEGDSGLDVIEEGPKLLGDSFELLGFTTIRAVTDCILINIDKERFYDYISSNKGLTFQILEKMTREINFSKEKKESLIVA